MENILYQVKMTTNKKLDMLIIKVLFSEYTNIIEK